MGDMTGRKVTMGPITARVTGMEMADDGSGAEMTFEVEEVRLTGDQLKAWAKDRDAMIAYVRALETAVKEFYGSQYIIDITRDKHERADAILSTLDD